MSRQILIVDDDDSILTIVKLSLEYATSWTVTALESSPEAVEFAKSELPDAIVLDYMMPELDGPEVLQILRADPKTANIPIIFLTAKAEKSGHQALKDSGAAGVLVKPFEPDQIAEQVKELLQWSD